MTKVEQLESEVAKLSGDELARFRQWFEQFDAEQWDRQFESDAASGKLDHLADRAVDDETHGRSMPNTTA